MHVTTDKTGISENQEYSNTLSKYNRELRIVADKEVYEDPEASIRLPLDTDLILRVENLAASLATPALKYVVVVGIGGSNLGTKAVYEARRKYNPDLPELLFVDTTNPALLAHTINRLKSTVVSPEEVVICSVTKSGGTTETIANTEIVLEALGDEYISRLVVITNEGSSFWKEAEKNGWHHISLPEQVGGRFSVFSAVGLVPLAVAGFDIRELMEGAAQVVHEYSKDDTNDAARAALMRYQLLLNGREVHNLFLFNDELASVGAWWQQLFSESLGKEDTEAPILPVVSIGSTDLHSTAQLYFALPDNKVSSVVYSAESNEGMKVQTDRRIELLPALSGMSAEEIMEAIRKGVLEAYEARSMPYLTYELDSLSLFSLGVFMQHMMFECIYLGKLLGVNTFNQPNVEAYKEKTRNILES